MADPELTKAFTEHQAKMVETNANVNRIKQQMEDLRMAIKSSQLTDREISSLPAGIRLYESVGRLFILTETSEVREHLKNNQGSANNKIKLLLKEKDAWEAKLQQSEAGIRELVQQKIK